MNQLSTQVVISAIIVALLQWAKKSNLVPWMTAATPKINRTGAIICSGCAAIGVHFTYTAAAGTLVISGLTFASIAHFFWIWIVSFVSQQTIFKATTAEPTINQDVSGCDRAACAATAGSPFLEIRLADRGFQVPRGS